MSKSWCFLLLLQEDLLLFFVKHYSKLNIFCQDADETSNFMYVALGSGTFSTALWCLTEQTVYLVDSFIYMFFIGRDWTEPTTVTSDPE